MAEDLTNVSLALLARQLNDARAAIGKPLHFGGGGGTSDGMETRVTMLEYRADQTEKLLVRMDAKLDALGRDVSEIKGTLTGLPKTWQVLTINLTVVGVVIAIAGGTVAFLHSIGKF